MPGPFASLEPSHASLTASDTLTTSTWNPWRGDIAQADFNLLVLGTSISWGQGLDKHEKFAHLVARALKRSRICTKPAIVSFAHSGACIWDGGYYQAFTPSFHLGNIPGASLNQRMRADILRLSPLMPALPGFITPSLVDT